MRDPCFGMAGAKHGTSRQNDGGSRNRPLDLWNRDVHIRRFDEQFHIPQTQSLSHQQYCFLHGLAIHESPISRIVIVQDHAIRSKGYIAMMR